MKKLLFLPLFALLLVACSQTEQKEPQLIPLEKFVAEFIQQNPNFKLNSVTKKEASEKFRAEILDSLNTTNLLQGVPLELLGLNQNGERLMAHFRAWHNPTGFEFEGGIIHNVECDIIASIPNEYATTLAEDKYYFIEGEFVEVIDGFTVAKILYGSSLTLWTPEIGIVENDIWNDKVDVKLGVLDFRINKVTPVE